MIVTYIDSHRERFGVEPICAVLTAHGVTIAPSTYYAHKAAPVSAAVLVDAYLANALYTLWVQNWRVYGARKLWKAARRAKIDVGRDQVARLIRIAGIRGVVRGRHTTVTTRADASAPRHPDLVRRGWDTPTATDELWVRGLLIRVDFDRVRVRSVHRRRVLTPHPGLAGVDEQANTLGYGCPASGIDDSTNQ